MAPDHDEGVAVLHRIGGGRRSQQANPAGGVGAVVGKNRLAQQRLDDRARPVLSHLRDLVAGVERAAPHEHRHLRPGVDDIRRVLQFILRRHRVLRHEDRRAMLLDVGVRAVAVRGRPILDILGMLMWATPR